MKPGVTSPHLLMAIDEKVLARWHMFEEESATLWMSVNT
jgi:hypothetical protein